MSKLTYSLLAGLAFVSAAQAEVPVYMDQELYIPGGVLVTTSGHEYYGDIRLVTNTDGTFSLADAHQRDLAYVNDIAVTIQESEPVQVIVTVEGDLSDPCVNLEQPGVYRDDDTFHVVLAETPVDPLAQCAQVLVAYEVDVELDVSGLDAGEYTVSVNGEETTFTLDTDN